MLLDIHTHHLPPCAGEAVLNCSQHEAPPPSRAEYLSAGIHPWHLTVEDYPLQREWLNGMLADKRVIALGEAGLDKLCSTSMDLQVEAFRYVSGLARLHGLPLIIHAVRSFNELVGLKKELKPDNPWIIHGFRGKKELAKSLVSQEFYLSFGERYQPETLQAVPKERLLLETDEGSTAIRELYVRAASLRGVDGSALAASVQQNIDRLFFGK